MSLFFVIPILVSGFIYCNKRYSEYIKLHRYQGQYLYLKAAKFGLFIFCISFTLVFLFELFLPLHYKLINDFIVSAISVPISNDDKLAAQYIFYTAASLTSLIFAYLISYLLNLKDLLVKVGLPPRKDENGYKIPCDEYFSLLKTTWRNTKICILNTILSDSPIEKMFIASYTNPDEQPLLITLSNRKVYVGNVIMLGEPNESVGMDQEIGIHPWLSGFRDENSHKVTFNTSYQSDDSVLPPPEEKGDFIVIRQDMIISASFWQIDVYKRVNSPRIDYPELSQNS